VIVIVDDYFGCGYEEAMMMMMIAVLLSPFICQLWVVVVATCSYVAGDIIHHDQEVRMVCSRFWVSIPIGPSITCR
jgi:hypothetical protein